HPEKDVETNRIYSINLADGKLTEVAAPRGPFGRLRVSPDGKTVVYVAALVDGPSPHDLFLLTLADGKSRNLTSTSLDRLIIGSLWTSNSKLVAKIQNGARTNFVYIASEGKVEQAGKFLLNPRTFDLSPSGTIAFVGSSSSEPEELWLRDGANAPQRI